MWSLCQQHKGDDRPLRFVSVAAGPAQELFEFLRDAEGPLPPLDILLFEQDPAALSYAQNRLGRIIETKGHTNVRMHYLKDSIKRLLTDATLFSGFGPFDLVFCAGLYDYLRHPTAVRLTRNFYDNLAPDGLAYIGNITLGNRTRWFMEHHMEWFVIHRTHEEMLAFAQEAAPDATPWMASDDHGLIPFVVVEKH
jgi:extracellular factor (EF) 3-hydroxypalmitic acid methyl ester biosynthesis protein